LWLTKFDNDTFLRALWVDRVMVHVFAGATLASLVGYSLLAWMPSFLIRSHGLTVAEAGVYIAATAGALGAVGTWLSGYLTERLQRRDIRWALWLSAAILIAIAPLAVSSFRTRRIRHCVCRTLSGRYP